MCNINSWTNHSVCDDECPLKGQELLCQAQFSEVASVSIDTYVSVTADDQVSICQPSVALDMNA